MDNDGSKKNLQKPGSSTANDLAPIIQQMINAETEKLKARTFRRAKVSTIFQCYADILVEGSTVITKNVLIAPNVRLSVGDDVLVLSIGESGTNLVIMANVTKQFPVGQKVTFNWRGAHNGAAGSWSPLTFPPGGKNDPDPLININDTWNWWRPQDPGIQMLGFVNGWFEVHAILRFDDWAVGSARGIWWPGAVAPYSFLMAKDAGNRWATVFQGVRYCVGGEYLTMNTYQDATNGGAGANIHIEVERIA